MSRRRFPEETRALALEVAVPMYVENCGVSALLSPSVGNVVARARQEGLVLHNSVLYKMWPDKNKLLADILGQLWEDDPYNTEAVTKAFPLRISTIMGYTAMQGRHPGLVRGPIIHDLGNILVRGINHRLASTIEAATESMQNPVLTQLRDHTRERHLERLANAYRHTHGVLHDTLLTAGTYTDYAMSASTVARGIALGSFNQGDPGRLSTQDMLFEAVANTYTAPYPA